ncbi:MAG TPA: site-specific integrase [Candidatus Paceibacterota bacterium]|nr:site-specific integrase [Candidatus Paceibacterota bacterium]
MVVRLIKNAWWVDFQFKNKRCRKRSPDNSRSGARDYEALLRQRLARGEPIDGDAVQHIDPSFADFADRWFENYVVPNNRYHEQRMKKSILQSSLIPFFGRMRIGEITGQNVEQYKARALNEGISRKTVNNRLAILRKCVNTAYEWLSLPGVPPKIVWLKCAPPRTDYLSADECALLLAHSSGVVREMLLTAMRTGMRQGELRGLQWHSINWENRSLVVRHSLNDLTKRLEPPKSNRERNIPLDLDLYEILYRRRESTGYVFLDANGKPFDCKRLIRRLRDVRKRAGIRNVGWHTLRHTFASHLAIKGVPLHVVQTLLGHSSIVTTMRYAHVAPSALRSAIDVLNPKAAVVADFGQPAVNALWNVQRNQTGDQRAAA